MKIAVLSGKGGAGKTLVSVNLAAVARSATYIDCDVEEPNGHLFFKPQNLETENVTVIIPEVIDKLCTGCRSCVNFCQFNALAYLQDQLLVFTEICHSCGGCFLVCPKKALRQKNKPIGSVTKGRAERVTVWTGTINTGESTGIPIIKRLLAANKSQSDQISLIDCPPGSACIVMESIQDADYCILVAEPTLFGLHNLKMVHELVRIFSKPHGVVLNKALGLNNPISQFCAEEEIKIIGEIPFESKLGTLNSNGKIAALEDKNYHNLFSNLLETVKKEVQNEATSNS